MLYLFLQLWEIMINGVEAFLYYLLVKKKMKAKEMPYRSQKITLFLCCQQTDIGKSDRYTKSSAQ